MVMGTSRRGGYTQGSSRSMRKRPVTVMASLLRRTAYVVVLVTALTGTASFADNSAGQAPATPADLAPMSATYGASMDKGLNIDGAATRSLQQQADGTWLYRFDVDSFIADIEESVSFRWQDGRIQPLEYRYSLKGLLVPNRSRAINFNYVADTVNGSYEGDTFTMALAEQALDPLGFQLQLRQDLKAGKREMSYTVADDGDYDQDRFAVIGEEALRTPQGAVQTLKLEKVRDGDSKRETLMWFAPALDYLLVRLVQVEPDGSRYEVNLKKADLPTGQ